ncbi:MAG: MBL fold metallo-hydrolase [Chloroflexaceae bacterium]|jgi:glyoxylase-like metal-dependent hydrolase (beta-lactamase superfamily II)|nr:MBL fold metallo-hydrolase [Chloroflexaceae bacterium]
MPLQQITERAYYLPGANNLGVIAIGDGGAIAVDTGLDKDVGRNLRKALDEAKLVLRAIISTHHHADHIGGNAYWTRNVPELRVYAPPLEASLIAHPVLEPMYLNQGAAPVAALRTRWLMAQPAPVHHVVGELEALQRGESQSLDIAGVNLELVPLPGHSPMQIGVAVDGVCFAADGLFGAAVLTKHGVPYAHDVAAQLASLERLAARGDSWVLPGHGELLTQARVGEVLAANRSAIERSSELVLAALHEPGGLAAVTARVIRALNHPGVGGIPQYAIFSGAIAAHLSYLEQQGTATVELTDDGLLWRH